MEVIFYRTYAYAEVVLCHACADDSDDEEDEGEPLRELSAARHVMVNHDFERPLCDELRAVFDGRTADPRATSTSRFLWDPWHCPTISDHDVTQYSLLRTQAAAYFPEHLHQRLADALLQYGEQQLVRNAAARLPLPLHARHSTQ